MARAGEDVSEGCHGADDVEAGVAVLHGVHEVDAAVGEDAVGARGGGFGGPQALDSWPLAGGGGVLGILPRHVPILTIVARSNATNPRAALERKKFLGLELITAVPGR